MCAALAKAILTDYPFEWNSSMKAPAVICANNFYLAFYASNRLVYEFLVDEYRRSGQNEYAEKLISQKGFQYPPTNRGHKTYVKGQVKKLMLCEYHNVPFDLLGYAETLFWIEYYNRQVIEENIFIKQNPERMVK